jgi:hypothetical protein
MATHTKVSLSKKQIILGVLVAALVGIALIPGFYFYNKYQKAQMELREPGRVGAAELEGVLQAVGKLMILPAGEVPTLATVSDKSKLSKEPFFAHAENGDKVLIYPKAKKAILFRPSKNLIIEFAPLNVPDQQNQATGSAQQQQQTYSVAVFNGSNTSGVASEYEKKITSASSQLKVVMKDNAVVKGYKKTIVVDLNNKSQVVASQIAQIVNGEVGSLPKGETKPKNADFLVIVGIQPKPTVAPTKAAEVTEVPTIEPSPTAQP